MDARGFRREGAPRRAARRPHRQNGTAASPYFLWRRAQWPCSRPISSVSRSGCKALPTMPRRWPRGDRDRANILACGKGRPSPASRASSCCCGRRRDYRARRSPSPPRSPRRRRRNESSTPPQKGSNGAARGRAAPNLSIRRSGGRRSRACARPSPKAPPSGRRGLAAPIAKPTACCAASPRRLCRRRPSERLALLDALLAGQALPPSLEIESHFLAPLLGDSVARRRDRFRTCCTKSRGRSRRSPPSTPISTSAACIDLAREGVAASFADGFESRLASVAHALAGAIQALDLDIAAIFGATSIEAIALDAPRRPRGRDGPPTPATSKNGRVFRKPTPDCARSAPPRSPTRSPGTAAARTRARHGIEAAFAEASWKQAIAADPDLAAFDGERHNALIAAVPAARSEAAARGDD